MTLRTSSATRRSVVSRSSVVLTTSATSSNSGSIRDCKSGWTSVSTLQSYQPEKPSLVIGRWPKPKTVVGRLSSATGQTHQLSVIPNRRRRRGTCFSFAAPLPPGNAFGLGQRRTTNDQRRPSPHHRHYTNIRQIPIPLRVIQPVPHHKLVWNREPNIIRLDFELPPRRLIQQHGHPKTLRLMPQQQTLDKRQRQPRVQNVLHQDHIFVAQRLVHVLGQPHLAGRIPSSSSLRRIPIAGHADKIKRRIQFHLPHQIAQENRSPL